MRGYSSIAAPRRASGPEERDNIQLQPETRSRRIFNASNSIAIINPQPLCKRRASDLIQDLLSIRTFRAQKPEPLLLASHAQQHRILGCVLRSIPSNLSLSGCANHPTQHSQTLSCPPARLFRTSTCPPSSTPPASTHASPLRCPARPPRPCCRRADRRSPPGMCTAAIAPGPCVWNAAWHAVRPKKTRKK